MNKYLWKYKFLGCLFLVLCLCRALTTLGLAYLLGALIDAQDIQALFNVILWVIGFSFVYPLVDWFYGKVKKVLNNDVMRQYREDVFKKIFSQSLNDYETTTTATYLSMLTNDIKVLEENYLEPLLIVIENAVLFIGALSYTLYYSPAIVLITMISLPISLYVPRYLGEKFQKYQEAYTDQLAHYTDKAKDLLVGFDLLHSYGSIFGAVKDFNDQNKQLSQAKLTTDKAIVFSDVLSSTVVMTIQFMMIITCVYQVLNHQMTMGVLIGIIQISNSLVNPLVSIMANLPKMKSVQPITEKFEKLMAQGEEITESHTFKSALVCENVSFSYDHQPVLTEINYRFEKNKKYLIVGRSGCGKSTLAKLLSGQLQPSHGHVDLDGKQPSKMLDVFSYVKQATYLFNTTLKENICLYYDFKQKDLQKALLDSGVAEFLSQQVPLDFKIEENGHNLSGGQCQRIALARALVFHRSILILDEGLSALDSHLSYQIEKQLLARQDLTFVSIAHHFHQDLLEKYDEIIFMDEGKIAMTGQFQTLKKECPEFRHLVAESLSQA